MYMYTYFPIGNLIDLIECIASNFNKLAFRNYIYIYI